MQESRLPALAAVALAIALPCADAFASSGPALVTGSLGSGGASSVSPLNGAGGASLGLRTSITSRRSLLGPVMMAKGGFDFGGIQDWVKKRVDENMGWEEERNREKPRVSATITDSHSAVPSAMGVRRPMNTYHDTLLTGRTQH